MSALVVFQCIPPRLAVGCAAYPRNVPCRHPGCIKFPIVFFSSARRFPGDKAFPVPSTSQTHARRASGLTYTCIFFKKSTSWKECHLRCVSEGVPRRFCQFYARGFCKNPVLLHVFGRNVVRFLSENNGTQALAAGIFHRKEVSISEVKDHLAEKGVPARRAA